MKENNIVIEKTYAFAILIVNCYKYLYGEKKAIAYKEARETNYWLRILRDSELLDKKISESLLTGNEEILKREYPQNHEIQNS
ncbi:MAG: four helix bundle protein [Dysgonamonadaceae bacterium]|jgi:hypothetical protein|nr:four helix bundle protein [Dysgonamonadaceae bacterium]